MADVIDLSDQVDGTLPEEAVPGPSRPAEPTLVGSIESKRAAASRALAELHAWHAADRHSGHVAALAGYVDLLEMLVVNQEVLTGAEIDAVRGYGASSPAEIARGAGVSGAKGLAGAIAWTAELNSDGVISPIDGTALEGVPEADQRVPGDAAPATNEPPAATQEAAPVTGGDRAPADSTPVRTSRKGKGSEGI